MTMGMRRAACAGVLLVGVALAGPSDLLSAES